MSERTMTVKELKDILDELWSVDEYHTEDHCEFNYDHPQVDRAVGYVDDLFITDKGQPNFDNIRELERSLIMRFIRLNKIASAGLPLLLERQPIHG